VIFNLAPFQPVPDDLLAVCDPLVVNEAEASALVGWSVHDAGSAARAVEQLRGASPSVVVTIGPGGACWADETGGGHVPAPDGVAVVDTTGAGDAFTGALAAALAAGHDLHTAAGWGLRLASWSVGRVGAQASYPRGADCAQLLGAT
jgi:ribokinase